MPPLDAVRRLSAALSNLALLRAEFAAVELAQARAQLLRWFALVLCAALLAAVGLMSLGALLVYALWPLLGAWAFLVPAAAAGLAAALLARRLRREVAEAPPLLAETLRELGRDRDALCAATGEQAAEPRR